MASTAKKIETALQEGNAAPACSLPLHGGAKFDLTDYKGRKNVVIYFYPKDDTPGCTTEAKDFRDLIAQFQKANTEVIGISKDSLKSHDKFAQKYELPFGLASDEGKDICETYGVWGEKNMYGKKYMGINRTTFLIDKEGKIARIWPKVSVPGHAAEVLEEAKKLG